MQSEPIESKEIAVIEAAVEASNAVAVPDPIRQALVRDLRPVADRLAFYSKQAEAMQVRTVMEAEAANQVCAAMAIDAKTVKDHEVLSRITDGLHKLHRQWTGIRDLFLTPLEHSRRLLKGKILNWQELERWKAEELRRKLQSEADAKVAREREALLKKAESVKSPEKQEAYREQAAAVITPTIHIEAPKAGIRSQAIVTCEIVSINAFVHDANKRCELCGYIDQVALAGALKKARIANPMFEAAGVVFGKKQV